MGKETDSPKAPDPNVVIPLQKEANLDVYKTMLNDSRSNQVTPFGTSTWTNNRTFDQAGYDAEVARRKAIFESGNVVNEDGSPVVVGGPSGGGFLDRAKAINSATTLQAMGFDPSTVDREKYYSPDKWENKVQLSPEQQQLYNLTTAGQTKQAGLLSSAIDRVKTGLESGPQPNMQSGELERSRVEKAMFDRAMRLMQPQMDQQRHEQSTRLQQSGFSMNNPEFERLQGNLDQSQGNQVADVADRSILAGGQEQDRMIRNLMAIRSMPLNELASIRSGTQITPPGTQSQFSTPGLQTTDVGGAYQNKYAGELNAYNADVSSDNATLGALASIAGAFLTGGGSLAATAAGAAGGGALGGLFGGRK